MNGSLWSEWVICQNSSYFCLHTMDVVNAMRIRMLFNMKIVLGNRSFLYSKQLFLFFSLSLFLVRGVSPLYSITRGPCNALKDQGFIMFYTGNMCAGPGQNRRGGVRGPPPVRHHHHYKTKEKTTRYLHHPCLRYRGTFPTFG